MAGPSRGRPKGRPPPWTPAPAINHFPFPTPFPSARGGRTAAQVGSGIRMSEKGVVRVQCGVGLRPRLYIGSLGGVSPTLQTHFELSTCVLDRDTQTHATEAALPTV